MKGVPTTTTLCMTNQRKYSIYALFLCQMIIHHGGTNGVLGSNWSKHVWQVQVISWSISCPIWRQFLNKIHFQLPPSLQFEKKTHMPKKRVNLVFATSRTIVSTLTLTIHAWNASSTVALNKAGLTSIIVKYYNPSQMLGIFLMNLGSTEHINNYVPSCTQCSPHTHWHGVCGVM